MAVAVDWALSKKPKVSRSEEQLARGFGGVVEEKWPEKRLCGSWIATPSRFRPTPPMLCCRSLESDGMGSFATGGSEERAKMARGDAGWLRR